MKWYTAGRMRMWLSVLIALAVVGVGGWYLYISRQPTNYTSQPEQTKPQTPAAPEAMPQEKPTSYTSRQGMVLKVDESPQKAPLSSPYTLTGQVPGNWSFEASFPVELVGSAGNTIAQSPAQLQGDWMTTDYVPFSVTLTFTQPSSLQPAKLILRKDNPSGLEEKADEVVIPVELAGKK